MHGDVFDMVVKHARWLALLGDTAYDLAILINRYFNAIRRRLGFSYWSLSQWAKHKVKNAVNYIGAFEQTLAAEAQRHRVDGVICGHIHHAAIHDDFGIRYINCGDWVESCTAVAEHADGQSGNHQLDRRRGTRKAARGFTAPRHRRRHRNRGLKAISAGKPGSESTVTDFQRQDRRRYGEGNGARPDQRRVGDCHAINQP